MALAESSEEGASQIMHSRHEENTKHEKDNPNEHESSELLADSCSETFLPTTQSVVSKNPDMETAVKSDPSKKPVEGEVSSKSPSFRLPKKQIMKFGVFHKLDMCCCVFQTNEKGLSQRSSRPRKARKLGHNGHKSPTSKSLKHNEDILIVKRVQHVYKKDFLKLHHQPSPYKRSCYQHWVWNL